VRTACALVVLAIGLGWCAHRVGGAQPAQVAVPAACGAPGIAWTRRLTSRGPIALAGMVATADGGLVIAGGRRGELRVEPAGAPPPSDTSATIAGGFLLRLAADGSVRWQRTIFEIEAVGAVAVRPDGTIVVGAISAVGHEASLEGPPVLVFPGQPRSLRLLVGVYGDDGTPRAAWTIGTISEGKERFAHATVTELAADGQRIALAGAFMGVMDLDGGKRRTTLVSAGATDLFVAALQNDGTTGWATRAGGANSDLPGPIALGRDGAVTIAGHTSNDGRGKNDLVTVGDGPTPRLARTGNLDALLAQLDRRGLPLWASTVGGDEPWGLNPPDRSGPVKPLLDETITGTIALPNGDTLFAGNAALPASFNGQAMLPARPGAAAGSFLARVSAAGKLTAATALGREHASAVAAAPGGDLFVAGELEGVTTYPAAGAKRVTMTSAGREDLFVARHAPDGTLRWAIRLGGRGHDRAERIAVDAQGAVTVAARFGEGFGVGDQPCAQPVPDAAVVDLIRFAPDASFSADDARERRLAAERTALSALRDDAAKAFEDGRYAQACAIYQKVAAGRPDSGAAEADVGLCLQRLGKRPEAIAANQKAIALASRTDLADDGDPVARRHATFNLYKLGVRAAVPKQGCRKLPADNGCRRGLWVCVGRDHTAGSRLEIDTTYARFAAARDGAEIQDGDQQETYEDSPIPNDQRDHVDVTVAREVHSSCQEGDGPDCGANDGATTCDIVHANACLGLIGAVCRATDGKANGRTEIEEIRLRPSPPKTFTDSP
jgi:hypothetical protein